MAKNELEKLLETGRQRLNETREQIKNFLPVSPELEILFRNTTVPYDTPIFQFRKSMIDNHPLWDKPTKDKLNAELITHEIHQAEQNLLQTIYSKLICDFFNEKKAEILRHNLLRDFGSFGVGECEVQAAYLLFKLLQDGYKCCFYEINSKIDSQIGHATIIAMTDTYAILVDPLFNVCRVIDAPRTSWFATQTVLTTAPEIKQYLDTLRAIYQNTLQSRSKLYYPKFIKEFNENWTTWEAWKATKQDAPDYQYLSYYQQLLRLERELLDKKNLIEAITIYLKIKVIDHHFLGQAEQFESLIPFFQSLAKTKLAFKEFDLLPFCTTMICRQFGQALRMLCTITKELSAERLTPAAFARALPLAVCNEIPKSKLTALHRTMIAEYQADTETTYPVACELLSLGVENLIFPRELPVNCRDCLHFCQQLPSEVIERAKLNISAADPSTLPDVPASISLPTDAPNQLANLKIG